jgi:hypothetical protein
MGQQSRIAVIILVIAFVFIQGALIAADRQQTPLRVAKQFTKDYHYLKPQVQNLLCSELAESELVSDWLYRTQQEAQQRGLPQKYLRHMFTELHLEVVEQDQESARVHVTGVTRRAINPAFMLVGKLFQIGQYYEVDTTLELIREENGWRICGAPFEMAPEV